MNRISEEHIKKRKNQLRKAKIVAILNNDYISYVSLRDTQLKIERLERILEQIQNEFVRNNKELENLLKDDFIYHSKDVNHLVSD